MSLWRQLTSGLRVLTRRTAADQDVADEVEHYLDEAAADLESRGLSRDAARREARLQVGNAMVVRERLRASGWEHVVGTSLADLRHAARQLRSAPAFAAVSVLTLALGIGASTAIFSAVNPILFQPLPYPDASRVTMVWDYGADGGRIEVTFGTYREIVARARSFDALGVMRLWQPTVTGGAEPERLEGQRVSVGYFRALGVLPALGRDFDSSDDRVNGPNVVILADGLWRRRFAGDAAIVGRQITLNDALYTVAGVMPGGFENVLSPSAEIWAPLQYDASLPVQGREWGHHLRMVGRLHPGVLPEQAARELETIARAPMPTFPRVPWASIRKGLRVEPLQGDVTRGVKPALVAVLGAVMLVLAIACVNVTNLLLARGAQRRGEFAMRVALGAGRSRIVRQVLAESLLLAAIGGVIGMAVARAGVAALVALTPPGLPRANAIAVDGTVLAFAIAITTLIGLVVGLVPALQASRSDPHSGIQHTSRGAAGGHRTARRTLVVAEVALALVLLVGAGLLLRSLQRLFAVEPGFNPSHALSMQVQIAGRRFANNLGAVRQFFDGAVEAVRGVPGVDAAAFTSQLPLSGDFVKYGVQWESAPNTDPNEDQSALRYAVTPDYFHAIGIPLRRGRYLDARDTIDAPPVAVINESFARRKFAGRDPIGQRAHIGDTSKPWFTIVGVVGDVRQTSLALGVGDAAYTTTAQWPFVDNPLWLVVRARGDAAALAPAIRRAVWSVDKDQPIVRVATLDALVAGSASERRFALTLFEAFALVALVLAAIGIYGVLAGSVAERTREIGVRSALGASRGDILALVLGQGLSLTVVGVAIGSVGAAAASTALVTLLFGISHLDPTTYLSMIAVLMSVSTAACWIPAWRAARVDPATTLRAE